MGFRFGLFLLCAAVLGIFFGFFFGPYCAFLVPVGEIYLMLLQMAILPYIPLSLIHGIGSLSPEMGKKLLRRGWYFIPLLWLIVYFVLYLLSLPIPREEVIIYERSSTDTTGFLNDLLTYLVPQNPLYDLANNILPAIAVFGVLVGIAMMLMKNKDPILPILERLVELLERIFQWLARLAPIAVFTHLAVAFGTVHFEELYKLEFYVVLVIIGTLFLTLWILPKLVEALGPFTYKELLREGRAACIIAFMTGVPTIAFPFILRAVARLMHGHRLHPVQLRSTSQTVVPFAFSFTQLGNFFLYLFIVFMGFFFRKALGDTEELMLPILTLFLSLGVPSTSINGVAFFIENLNWPEQAIKLYGETSAIVSNFQVMLSIAGVMSFILLVLLSYYKLVKIRWNKLFLNIGLGFACFFAFVYTIKENFHLKDNFYKLFLTLRIPEIIDNPIPFKVDDEQDKAQIPNTTIANPLRRVLENKLLRVGYDVQNIPFCYLNEYHELVGFDIAFAFKLASNLGCALEFVPLNRDLLAEELNTGKYDIAMSALLVDEERIQAISFCQPYAEEGNVLLVPKSRLDEFPNYETVRANPHFHIGAGGAYVVVAKNHFPNALVTKGKTIKALLDNEVDCIVWSKLPAFIWCLSNPGYAVVDFGDVMGKRYFSYGIQQNAIDWVNFIDEWLKLNKEFGFTEKQDAYWFKGKLPEEPKRWSMIQNVLHWVK